MPFTVNREDWNISDFREIESIIAKYAEGLINGFMSETWDEEFHTRLTIKDSGEWCILVTLGEETGYEKFISFDPLFELEHACCFFNKSDTDRLAKKLEDIASKIRSFPVYPE